MPQEEVQTDIQYVMNRGLRETLVALLYGLVRGLARTPLCKILLNFCFFRVESEEHDHSLQHLDNAHS